MDDPKKPKPAFGRGRARSRIRGSSPVGAPSADLTTLSNISTTSSAYTGSGTSGSSITLSEVASDMHRMSIQSSSVKSTPVPVPEKFGFPRGRAIESLEQPEVRVAGLENRRGNHVITRPPGTRMEGRKGKQINLRANYFRMQKPPSWGLHQYMVDFNMEDDRTSFRKKLFRKALEERDVKFGWMFDGAQLFTPKRLEDYGIPMEMTTKLDKPDDSELTIIITYAKLVDSSAPIYVKLHDILFRKFLFALELQKIGCNFFDPAAAIQLSEQKLELWPGYVTSMRADEKGVFLCVEVIHMALRTDSVLEIMHSIERAGNLRDDDGAWKAAIQSDLKDTIVMTIYNMKTHHVDDIDFELSPKSTFDCSGTSTSYADYYKQRYGLAITDLDQPLIVSRRSTNKDIGPKDQGGKGEKTDPDTTIMLIPELCLSTGLTNAMKTNSLLKKELYQYLHQIPGNKMKLVKNFMMRLKTNKLIAKDLEIWGLQFEDNLGNC